MEVGKQSLLPCALKGGGAHLCAGLHVREGREGLRFAEGVFRAAVPSLDAALRGVAALEEEVEFVFDEGQAVADGLGFLEEFAHRPEFDRREDGPCHHLISAFHVAPGRSAAVVADAVDDKPGLEAPGPRGDVKERLCRLRGDAAVVPVLFAVVDHFPPGRGFPSVEREVFAESAAVIIILHAAEAVDLGQVRGVAEGIGGEVDLEAVGIDAPVLREVLLRVRDVPQQRFRVRHVLVGLDPRGGRDLPAALVDAGLDAVVQLRRVFVDDLIAGRLGLAEAEVRVFVHDVQHGREGGDGGGDGLRPRPHPVHVDVRVSGEDELVRLRVVPEGQEHFLRLVADGPDERAVAFHGLREEIEGG